MSMSAVRPVQFWAVEVEYRLSAIGAELADEIVESLFRRFQLLRPGGRVGQFEARDGRHGVLFLATTSALSLEAGIGAVMDHAERALERTGLSLELNGARAERVWL
ncbi:hypothetical protein GIS00_12055 [Nakamurella sp. YIM 132087]|uniref:Uncharacterized protein n=1 Tax=Nakamurella alba TaxID=2665158 RepID=A0A7K1FKQ9_9ACTN|nr:hypothetical protein [Nakamurella alba]MTD14676.1 hypothetical protein [Nakamurella alba]